MKIISLCFFLTLLLPLANAAEKDCLPSGERVDNFLMRQVGGGYAELTTDSQQKKPLQLLMEEMVLADGRRNPPGRIIDEQPDTAPQPPPDITPRLTSVSLHSDVAAVNAHWDFFLKRYFYLGNYFQERKVRPKLIHKLSPDVVKQWKSELFQQRISGKIPKKKDEYYQFVGEGLLYADFLFARGDEVAKAEACDLLGGFAHVLIFSSVDQDMAKLVGVEMAWPMLKYIRTPENYMEITPLISSASGYDTPNGYRMLKWRVNRGKQQSDADNKTGSLLLLSNAYAAKKDYLGAALCSMSAYPSGSFPDCEKTRLQNVLKLRWEKERGAAYYQRFLEIIAPAKTVSAVNTPQSDNGLSLLKQKMQERSGEEEGSKRYKRVLEGLATQNPQPWMQQKLKSMNESAVSASSQTLPGKK